MSSLGHSNVSQLTNVVSRPVLSEPEANKSRKVIKGCDATILADIYRQEANIVIWQRELADVIRQSVKEFIVSNPTYKASISLTPEKALRSLRESLGGFSQPELCEDIAELVDMFCLLFELDRAGLRLSVLDNAMCPKFHVDHVPCRLVTTYQGVATDWLHHECVNREKLGQGSNGLPDHQSGLFQSEKDIQHLNTGDVALLKGERWEGNEHAGLVHRSPMVSTTEPRLLLTLDFSY